MDEKITSVTVEKRYKRYLLRRFICRIVLCVIAVGALTASAAVKLSDVFSAESLAEKAFDGRITVIKENEESNDKTEYDIPDEAKDIHPEDQDNNDNNIINNEDTGENSAADLFPIIYSDLSRSPEYGEVIINSGETDYDIDADEIRSMNYPAKLTSAGSSGDSSPIVLIVHTHTTESYVEGGEDGYCDKEDFRTTDIEKNVVAVGKVILDKLCENGIPAVQCTTLHDTGDFYESYEKCEQSVKEYLEKYPGIRYILDVHRDSITRNDNEQIATEAEIDGIRAAQLMFVVGTDKFGADHPDWKQNLRVAVSLQSRLNSAYRNIARPISLRGASFNEQYSPGYLLLEVGSCANTLEEAKISASAFAEIYAGLIKEYR
ncbi:MAG: stage II sporulation protein P [Clostridia bacterium]|nr:stage II sporulation protein P [Clostridia bacterium]